MHQKQFIEANLACQRFEQLFIHVCLLRIDFSQRKLTGRMNERHCIAYFQFFTLMNRMEFRADNENKQTKRVFKSATVPG